MPFCSGFNKIINIYITSEGIIMIKDLNEQNTILIYKSCVLPNNKRPHLMLFIYHNNNRENESCYDTKTLLFINLHLY